MAGNVTATTDYLFLLAEFEVFGSRYYANDYERNSQLQYDYYKASNSRVAYKHNATGTAVWWWLRSPLYDSNNYFCDVYAGGGHYSYNAYYSAALLPGFYRYTVKWSSQAVKDDRCKRRDTSQGETPETAL